IPSGAAGGYDWSPDAWVAVPAAGPVRLAFSAHATLVARGALDVAFSVPAAGLALLDAYDLRGRRVASSKLDAGRAGTYSLRPAEAGVLHSGMYFLRLTQGPARVQGRALLLPAP